MESHQDMYTPRYIYKIVPSSSAPETPLPDALPVSDLDRNDGFLHLSTSVQIPGTLGRYFSGADAVYILRIEYKKVEKDIRWEDARGKYGGGPAQENFYPHLYNGLRLGINEVDSFQKWENCAEGWRAAVQKAEAENWFIY